MEFDLSKCTLDEVLKKYPINQRRLYGTLGTLALFFFYTLGSAILQTSYRLNPLTQEEINQK